MIKLGTSLQAHVNNSRDFVTCSFALAVKLCHASDDSLHARTGKREINRVNKTLIIQNYEITSIRIQTARLSEQQ